MNGAIGCRVQEKKKNIILLTLSSHVRNAVMDATYSHTPRFFSERWGQRIFFCWCRWTSEQQVHCTIHDCVVARVTDATSMEARITLALQYPGPSSFSHASIRSAPWLDLPLPQGSAFETISSSIAFYELDFLKWFSGKHGTHAHKVRMKEVRKLWESIFLLYIRQYQIWMLLHCK